MKSHGLIPHKLLHTLAATSLPGLYVEASTFRRPSEYISQFPPASADSAYSISEGKLSDYVVFKLLFAGEDSQHKFPKFAVLQILRPHIVRSDAENSMVGC